MPTGLVRVVSSSFLWESKALAVSLGVRVEGVVASTATRLLFLFTVVVGLTGTKQQGCEH